MFHSNTRSLISTWNEHRHGRRLPARTDLSPIDLGPLLPQVFILGREPDGQEVFRLAGGLIADLHGQDLRAMTLTGLWPTEQRRLVAEALDRARAAASPVVLTVDASADTGGGIMSESVGVEITLAPLTGPTGAMDRTIGLYQPISTVARLMGRPVARLDLRSVELAGNTAPRSHLRLVVLNGQRVA